MSGSVLTAQSLEPASDSVSPSLSTPPLLVHCLCLSKMNKHKKMLKKKMKNTRVKALEGSKYFLPYEDHLITELAVQAGGQWMGWNPSPAGADAEEEAAGQEARPAAPTRSGLCRGLPGGTLLGYMQQKTAQVGAQFIIC